jgi:hypothetical protein
VTGLTTDEGRELRGIQLVSRFDPRKSPSQPGDGTDRLQWGRSRCPVRCLGLVALICLLAGPVAANPPSTVPDSTPRVAGAIEAAPATEATGNGPRVAARTPEEPLTRARLRARIEAIDPEQWLSRYGQTEQHQVAHP